MTIVSETVARRIVFGEGAVATLPAELAGLGLARPLVIAGRSQASHAERLLAAVGAGGSIIGVRVHVPAELPRMPAPGRASSTPTASSPSAADPPWDSRRPSR